MSEAKPALKPDIREAKDNPNRGQMQKPVLVAGLFFVIYHFSFLS